MARSGILAARLAEEGFSGPAEVFEGRKGLFNGYAGPDQYTTEWLCADAASKPSSTQGHS
jgi:2-methylcitrate dehydratase PrpD